MSYQLHSASILSSASDKWQQTYCENGVALILQLEDKNKGHLLLEELAQLLKTLYPQTLVEFSSKIVNVVERFSSKKENLALGALRVVEEKGFFYSQGTSMLLARGKKTTVLLKDNGAICGLLQDNDRIILLNREGVAVFGWEKLTLLFTVKSTVEAAAEELVLKMHTEEAATAICGLIIQTQEEKKKEIGADYTLEIFTRLQKLNIKDKLAEFSWQIITSVVRLARKRKVWLGLSLFFLLAVFLSRFQPAETDLKHFSESFELARHQYEEGRALIGLNRLRARDVLSNSKSTLKKLKETLKKEDEEYKSVSGLLLEVEQALKKARSAYKVEPELFFDLSLVRDGLTASLMKQAGDKVFLLSPTQRLIAMVDIQTKASKVAAGGKWFGDISHMTVVDERQYVLSPQGVSEISDSQQLVIEKDAGWGEIKDLEYFEGNLYLLDKKGVIWKYVSIKDGFSEKKDFLKGNLSLKNPFSMAIDGVVWLVDDSKVLKFIGGRRDSFYVQGLEEPLGIEAQIVKTAELDNLYILDKQKNRIVVLGEDGIYKAQYTWKDLSQVSDFVVSGGTGQIYLLKQDKIFSFKLE